MPSIRYQSRIVTDYAVLICTIFILCAGVATAYGANKTESDIMPYSRMKRGGEMGPYTYTDADKKALLHSHNKYREKTKASNMLLMEWDDEIEQKAVEWAEKCVFEHPNVSVKTDKFEHLGQNLYIGSAFPKTTTEPVDLWYDEIEYYTYSTMKCSEVCGHYTQVVWADTYAVGCAIQYCPDIATRGKPFGKGYIVVCDYGPGGNYYGKHPYKEGDVCSECPKTHKYCKMNSCSTIKPSTTDSGSEMLHPQIILIEAALPALVFAFKKALFSLYL